MANWRVIVSGNSGDGFWFRIEDIRDATAEYPFVGHGEYQALQLDSVEALRRVLTDMLKACDKPIMEYSGLLKELPAGTFARATVATEASLTQDAASALVNHHLLEALRPFAVNFDHSGDDPSGQCEMCRRVSAARVAIAKAEALESDR